jgi:hypothetical protein
MTDTMSAENRRFVLDVLLRGDVIDRFRHFGKFRREEREQRREAVSLLMTTAPSVGLYLRNLWILLFY